jgi:GNAT superfamily N-acetyltransferase
MMPPDISIRPLVPAEADAALPALARILVDAVANGASVNFMAGFDEAGACAFWRGQFPGLAEGMRHILVAEAAGTIVGTVIIAFAPQPNQPHRADIGKMLVHSSQRGRGIGKALLETAEAFARASGRTLLTLDTVAGSAGDRLYRRSGWTAFGTVPGYALTTDGQPAPATFFYKLLDGGAHG